jgi:hypothetical protein
MENTQQMAIGIMESLNSPAIQNMLNPMFAAAYAQGKIKTAADMEKLKTDFVLWLIASTPELMGIMADDVYNAVKAKQVQP